MLNITITINDPDAERVATAFGKKLNLQIPATEELIKSDLGNYIKQVTLQQEQSALYAEAQQQGAEIAPIEVV